MSAATLGLHQGGARLGVTYCFLPCRRGRACLHELQRAFGWAIARGEWVGNPWAFARCAGSHGAVWRGGRDGLSEDSYLPEWLDGAKYRTELCVCGKF